MKCRPAVRNNRRITLMVALACIACGPVQATDRYFAVIPANSTTVCTNWFSACWASKADSQANLGLPLQNDDVYLANTVVAQSILYNASGPRLGTIRVSGQSTLLIGANLDADHLIVAGQSQSAVQQYFGDVAFAGSVFIGRAGLVGSYVLNGGTFNMYGERVIQSMQVGVEGSGSFLQRGGVVTTSNLAVGGVTDGVTGNGLYAQSGGTTTVERLILDAGGVYNLDGGALNVTTRVESPLRDAGLGGTFNYNGGSLNLASDSRVSNFNLGNVSFNQVRNFTIDRLTLGLLPGQAGAYSLGAGTLSVGNIVKGQGTGTFTYNGGNLLFNGSSINVDNLYVGATFSSAAKALLTISKDQSVTVANEFKVGVIAGGEVSVSNGGTMTTQNAVLGQVSGLFGKANGTISVDGVGSKWIVQGDAYLGGTATVPGGLGTLNISNAGAVDVRKMLMLWSDGTVNLNGGTLTTQTLTGTAASNFNLAGGTLRFTGAGATAKFDGSKVGFEYGDGLNPFTGQFNWTTGTLDMGTGSAISGYLSPGSLVLDGGRTLKAATIGAGLFATGALNLNSGGSAVSANGVLGMFASGSALVDGAGSRWTIGDSLTAGANGTGSLIVSNGGQVTSTTGIIGGPAVTTGFLQGPAGNGSVTVTGIGSLWDNAGNLFVGGNATSVGDSGALLIQDQGRVSVGGDLTVWSPGVVNVGNGTLAVAGRGTVQGAMALSGGNVGFTGAATIAAGGGISGNGTLATGGLTNTGTLAFATLGGAALDPGRPVDVSTVNGFVVTTAGGTVNIGARQNVTFNDGVDIRNGATLSIAGGSTATFLGSVNQRRGATLSGEGSKTYAGGFTLDFSPTLGTDAGDITFATTNRYDARIGGTALGDALGNGIGFAHYAVAGRLTFGGILRVSELKGYAPRAGDSYDLFDWDTSDGTFSSIDFTAAPLSNGLAWDTSHLYIDGTLTVAAVPEPGSYAMFVAGLGLMGFMIRRRQQRARV